MKQHLSIFAAIVAFSLVQPTLANIEELNILKESQVQKIVDTKRQLELSYEQETKFSPIYEQHIEERGALLKKYGLHKEGATISLRKLRAFRNEMRILSDDTRSKVSEVLTNEQLKKWDLIQEQYRMEMRGRFYK